MTALRSHHTAYADYVWGLQLDGYQRSMRLNTIDAQVISDYPCEECGGERQYQAWRRDDPRGYRRLAVCRGCGAVEEF